MLQLEPPLKRAGLRGVKNAHLMPFEEYARKGTKTCNSLIQFFYLIILLVIAVDKMDVVLDEGDLSSQYIQSCLEQWQRVVIFYSLRLMVAPVIETIVQLDRLLYLAEQGK